MSDVLVATVGLWNYDHITQRQQGGVGGRLRVVVEKAVCCPYTRPYHRAPALHQQRQVPYQTCHHA